jgi:hypothetical protein
MEYFDTGNLDFRVRSRPMIVRTNCAVGDPEQCNEDYFVRTGDRFRHLHSERKFAAR